MIKWNYFWKLFLHVFTILLVGFIIWLGNYSSAYELNFDLEWCFYGGDQYNCISNDLTLEDDWKNWLYIKDRWWLRNNDYYIFWNNWKLYLYWFYSWWSDYNQWYFSKACKVYWTWRCTLGLSSVIADEFYSLSWVNFTKAYFGFYWWTDDPHFCFYNSNNWYNYCFEVFEAAEGTLSWSLNIWSWHTDFTRYAWNSPFYVWWSPAWSQWSNEVIIDDSVVWDYSYAGCTWKDVLIALESEWYNKYVCYWWLDNFNLYDSSLNYNPIPWWWLSLNQIWSWSWSRAWDSFSDWFTFWNWLYKDSTNYVAMWESYPAVYYTYFQLYNTYKWSVLNPRTILEYCQIRNFTWDILNNSPTGYFKPTCESIIVEKQTWVWNQRLDWTIYSWWVYTWDIPVSVNWSWVWNMSWLEVKSDWLSFIQDFFNLAKDRVPTNFSGSFNWFIPSYIVVFLLALILFRFLRH